MHRIPPPKKLNKYNPSNYTIELAGIDLVKYIMAFAVVAIHFRPNFNAEWQYPKLFEWFIRLAVPYFFITSGFLVQRKLLVLNDPNERNKYLETRTKKLIKLWIYWVLISIPMALVSYGLITGNGITNIAQSLKSYIWMLAIGGWAPYAAPLWFLYSMIWITLILRLSIGFKKCKYWLLVSFIIITIAYWGAKHFEIPILKTFDTYTHNILGGGVYILSGMLMVGLYQFFKPIVAIFLLLISVFLFYLDMPLSVEIGGSGLFVFALLLPIRKSYTLLSLRIQSMWIYFTHEYVLFLFFVVITVPQTGINPYLLMFIVFVTVALLAKSLNILQTKPNYKVLNDLVS